MDDASGKMASPSASAAEKVEAPGRIFGSRWTKDLITSGTPQKVPGVTGRGIANPATNQPARKLRAGLHEEWSAAGVAGDADSAGWWASIERCLAGEASRNGWDDTLSLPEDWLISNLWDPYETRWDSTGAVRQNADRRQPTSKLWLAATARESMASDTPRRKLAVAQRYPQSAFEITDAVAGGSVANSTMGRASLESAGALGIDQDEAATGGPRS